MIKLFRRCLLPAFVVCAVLVAPAAASANTLYASLTGAGPTCSSGAPCTLPTAVSTARNGDTVIVMSGTYSDLPTIGSQYTITVQGETPRPVLRFKGDDGGGLELSGSLVNVELDNPAGAAPAANVDGLIDRVVARGQAGCEIVGNGSVIRDSVCVGATGIGLWVTGSNGDAMTVRNVTAIGATAGVEERGFDDVCMNESMSATVVNTLARATGSGATDVHAASESVCGGADTWTSSITISYSNFATSVVDPGSSITDGGHNQTAAPLFVNQGAGDFHQAPGSPTINAGVNDPANGATDLDGNNRAVGASTDMGAYEFVPPTGGGSSSFTMPHPSVARSGALTFSLTAPGAGTFTATATTTVVKVVVVNHHRKHKSKKVGYGSASSTVSRAGAVSLVIRPSGAAKAALAKGAHLTVLVTITFTPAGGSKPTAHVLTITVSKPKHH